MPPSAGACSRFLAWPESAIFLWRAFHLRLYFSTEPGPKNDPRWWFHTSLHPLYQGLSSTPPHLLGSSRLKLEDATDEEKQNAFDEIVPIQTMQLIHDVSMDFSGSKLLNFRTQAQKDLFVVDLYQRRELRVRTGRLSMARDSAAKVTNQSLKMMI